MKSIVLTSVVVAATVFLSLVLGQESDIKLVSFEDCSPKVKQDPTLDWSVSDDGGQISFSGTAQLEKPIDMKNIQFKFELSIKDGETYMKVFAMDGDLCEHITTTFGTTWDRVRSKIVPEIKDHCKIEPGAYKLENFIMDRNDKQVTNFLPSGPMKIKVEAQQEGTTLQCGILELNKE